MGAFSDSERISRAMLRQRIFAPYAPYLQVVQVRCTSTGDILGEGSYSTGFAEVEDQGSGELRAYLSKPGDACSLFFPASLSNGSSSTGKLIAADEKSATLDLASAGGVEGIITALLWGGNRPFDRSSAFSGVNLNRLLRRDFSLSGETALIFQAARIAVVSGVATVTHDMGVSSVVASGANEFLVTFRTDTPTQYTHAASIISAAGKDSWIYTSGSSSVTVHVENRDSGSYIFNVFGLGRVATYAWDYATDLFYGNLNNLVFANVANSKIVSCVYNVGTDTVLYSNGIAYVQSVGGGLYEFHFTTPFEAGYGVTLTPSDDAGTPTWWIDSLSLQYARIAFSSTAGGARLAHLICWGV